MCLLFRVLTSPAAALPVVLLAGILSSCPRASPQASNHFQSVLLRAAGCIPLRPSRGPTCIYQAIPSSCTCYSLHSTVRNSCSPRLPVPLRIEDIFKSRSCLVQTCPLPPGIQCSGCPVHCTCVVGPHISTPTPFYFCTPYAAAVRPQTSTSTTATSTTTRRTTSTTALTT